MYKGCHCQTFAIWWEANWRPIEMKIKLQRCLRFRGSFGPCSTPKDKLPFYFWKQCTRCKPWRGMLEPARVVASATFKRPQSWDKDTEMTRRHPIEPDSPVEMTWKTANIPEMSSPRWSKWINELEAFGDDFKIFQGNVARVPNAKFSMSLPVLGSQDIFGACNPLGWQSSRWCKGKVAENQKNCGTAWSITNHNKCHSDHQTTSLSRWRSNQSHLAPGMHSADSMSDEICQAG